VASLAADGIFDTFETEDGRAAHLNGPIPRALGKVAGELLASEPSIRPADIIAVKQPATSQLGHNS
jgi:hypothetical protein